MADILIRGMDMPQHCFNCSTKIDPNNRRCNIDGHVFVETLSKLTCRRDEKCPLAELPPHGDLIDKEKLYDLVKQRGRNWAGEWCDFECHITGNDLKNAPVVIPSNNERSEDE